MVVRPRNLDDVRNLFAWCSTANRHITFRAAGTSLSGQAVTDDILMDVSRGWDHYQVMDNGERIRLGPGITGGRANGILRRFGKKIGPDPASINAAMIGGIVANNASGMCCGTKQNSYNTLEEIDVLLPTGIQVTTSRTDAEERLRSDAPHIYTELLTLRDTIRNDATLAHKLRTKYRIKNTMGYSLNAFLDESEASRIIARLMVGSEGTLGFINSVTLRTIPEPRERYTQLFVYDSVEEACYEALRWSEAGAAAVELMDNASLVSFAQLPSTPERYRFHAPHSTALLVEFQDTEPDRRFPWEQHPKEQALLWRLRKGLMPSIGAQRQSGATMINEDVAVPPQYLSGLVTDVQALFRKHGYHRAIIFGHAKDGNIHFVLNQQFHTDQHLLQYDAFMNDIANIVVGSYNGSLKAEHGTGRNMAPFLRTEWGDDVVNLMWRVKNLLDPSGILNPDVILSTNSKLHIQNIKSMPTIDAEVDACIECGFCEHVCPTRSVTLTPRQRIVLRRERALAQDLRVQRELERAEGYFSITSCAVDGMCEQVCPVGINTGKLVKRLRSERAPSALSWLSNLAARHYGLFSRTMKVAARFAFKGLKPPSASPKPIRSSASQIIFIPSCPQRWRSSQESLVLALAHAAGVDLVVPEHYHSMCCGQPFESQGYQTAAAHVRNTVLQEIARTGRGAITHVLTDTGTCAAALNSVVDATDIVVLTPVQWLLMFVLPNISIQQLPWDVLVYEGCSQSKLHETEPLANVLHGLVRGVHFSSTEYCCGMAGIHGIRYPEVPKRALESVFADTHWDAIQAIITTNTLCSYAIAKNGPVPSYTLLELAAMAAGLCSIPHPRNT